jgi:hypothetical protein
VIEDKDVFVEGERRLGRYTVVILRQSGERWTPAMLQLDATVTNFRLLLRPHRKKYQPASLPEQYITAIEMKRQERYHCIELQLSTNHVLYLMLSTGRLENFYDDLHAMKAPRPHFQFDEKVAKQDIERLITFFGREPLSGETSS